MFHTVEKFRITKNSPFASNESYGNNGAFVIPHFKIQDYFFFCIISDGEGWEHVSVTLKTSTKQVQRCPNWEDMCFVKNLFWDKDDLVIQYHPMEKDYVNLHPFCLHLWNPIGQTVPIPPKDLIGF